MFKKELAASCLQASRDRVKSAKVAPPDQNLLAKATQADRLAKDLAKSQKKLETVTSRLEALKKSAAATLAHNKQQIQAQKEAIQEANNQTLSKIHVVDDLKKRCNNLVAEHDSICQNGTNMYWHIISIVQKIGGKFSLFKLQLSYCLFHLVTFCFLCRQRLS